jgi:hypothetical protein
MGYLKVLHSIGIEMEFGYIYKITCVPTGKQYVGQAREHKLKNGKAYKYGIQGRWSDHVSSSKSSSTPLANAIQTHGRDAFKVEEVEKAPLNSLDALEAKWITEMNTFVPNGYNVMRHSRVKNRNDSNIDDFFKGHVQKAKISKIYKETEHKLIYVYLTLTDSTTRRLVFGQTQDTPFATVYNEALEFVKKLNCPFEEDTSHSTNIDERYASKLKELSNETITKIRITSASSLIAVYITTQSMKNWKEQNRICFGGKTISKEDAYQLAKEFVAKLPKSPITVVLDKCQSPQQVAASTGETSP